MDIFKFGLRNILGLTLPGAIICFFISYTIFTLFFVLGKMPDLLALMGQMEFLILLTAFVVSYIIGSIIRLNAAQDLDTKSGIANRLQWCEDNPEWTYFEKENCDNLEEVTIFIKKHRANILKDEYEKKLRPDNWIWRFESFPYPIWQFRKFELYHPQAVREFFTEYQSCMGLPDKNPNKEFFNFCKMSIYNTGRNLDDTLVQEVYYAEAFVRYAAGMFTAFTLSRNYILTWLLGIHIAILGWITCTNWRGLEYLSFSDGCLFFLPTVIVLITIVLFWQILKRLEKAIVSRFRTLRLKEVDIVYDSFYLINKHNQTSVNEKE